LRESLGPDWAKGKFIQSRFCGVDQFELVYQGSLRNLTGTEDIILAREKEAVQSSGGRWARTYVFVDGHSGVHAETSHDFTAWEQQRNAKAALKNP
jgi:hypothetical protein